MRQVVGKHGRSLAAVAAGALAYLAVLYRGPSYTQRNQLSPTSYLIFAVLLVTAGFGLAYGLTRDRYRLAWWMLAGVWSAHSFVVWNDWRTDPTDHNLLPFEYIILAIVASPAYLGVAAAHVAGYLAGGRSGTNPSVGR